MCTSVLVGEKATADGSFLIARSADSNALKAQHFVIHPAQDHEPGAMYRCKDHEGDNEFEYPLPEHAMRYTTVANWQTGLHGAVGFNEAGVGLSGTESIFASDIALSYDPYNTETGITEDDIPDVLLPRCRTAKEACRLLGQIIEEHGAGEGFGVGFADANEIWYIETGCGHQWMAQRIPADKYFASGNQGRLRDYDPANPDQMASPAVIEFAQINGLYDPDRDGKFDFAKAYTRDDVRDRTYNDPRVWIMQKLLNPSLQQPMDQGRDYEVFLKPEEKVTVNDLKAVMRNHFEGTEYDPYSTDKLSDEDMPRPISVFRTYESHILQVRPNLPMAIGNVIYMAWGMADLSCYLPYYQGLDTVPDHYGMGTAEADRKSIYWKYRKLQTLAMTDYDTLAPVVKEGYTKFEAELAKKQQDFEAKYIELVKTDALGARDLLNAFNLEVLNDAEELTEALTDKLFTIRTKDIQDKIYFKNRNLKD